MASIALEELRSFHEFIVKKLEESGPEAFSPEEALDLWRLENPTPEEHEANLKAIQEGLEDMKAGRMRPAREVLAELRAEYNVPDAP